MPVGRKVMLAFPGGGGYGNPQQRDRDLVRRDLLGGYITEEVARSEYGLSDADIQSVNEAVKRGDAI